MLIQGIGRDCHIHPSVRLRFPQKIWIGDQAEIRRGCGLYARTERITGIYIGTRCRIKEFCILDSYGGSIKLGQQVLLGQGSTIHGHGCVEIGDYTLIGAHTTILSNNHSFAQLPNLIQDQPEIMKPTTIGRNVWIGASVVVLAGVTIGDNSVIGAGAVVTHSIPLGSLAYGVPATVRRQLIEKVTQ